jgi:hypothetical protein
VACLGASCGSSSRRTIVIHLNSDGTCCTYGKTVALQELGSVLRDQQKLNPRMDLHKVEVLFPWDVDEEECDLLRPKVVATLKRLGLGPSISFSQPGNPYVAFAVSTVPWVVVAAVAGAIVLIVRKRRREGGV